MRGVVGRLYSIVVIPAAGWWSGRAGHRAPGPVLLHGPSGGGKRFLAEAVAESLDAPFVPVDLPDLVMSGSAGAGGSDDGQHPTGGRNLSASVGILRELVGDERCVVWLGGVDRLVGSGRAAQRRLAALLEAIRAGAVLDRAICLGSTEAPWLLEPEMLSGVGFDRFVHVPPPDWHARLLRIQRRADRRDIDVSRCLEHVARAASGWSGDEIDALVDELALAAGELGVVLPQTVDHVRRATGSEMAQWRSRVLRVLAHHDERGGFDDLVPHLSLSDG
jgi:SpoVK/Ycf46/Vps4 family AAA+-type ATPase